MPQAPQSLTQTPGAAGSLHTDFVPPDPLSQVLSLVRMRGELICRSVFAAPFGLAFPAGPAHFHAVEAGEIWVTSDADERPMRVSAGSFLIFPRGDGHVLMDAPRRPVVPLADAIRSRSEADRAAHLFRFGGDGEAASLLCVRFSYENPLAGRWLEALPRVIVLPTGWDRASDDLARSARALMAEVESPDAGSAIMVSRLIDLVYVQMLRLWARRNPAQVGWLAGASDARISRALSAIHTTPAQAWTVPALASIAGLARSAFASRFVGLIGKPPLAYLTDWRLNMAADRLRGTVDPVGVIAAAVGYTSEAGFSRAFRARFGRSPSQFRAEKHKLLP